MPNEKLTQALSKLRRIAKNEGYKEMTAEELTQYAEEQIAKAAADADNGSARLEHLREVCTKAVSTFSADPVAKVEVELFQEPATPDPAAAIMAKLDDIKTLVTAKAIPTETIEVAEPSATTVHPPTTGKIEDGGATATAGMPTDEGQPRGAEFTKADGTDEKKEEEEPKVAKSIEGSWEGEDAQYAWPHDLNSKNFRGGIEKRAENRPFWGYDNEPPPAA